MARGLAGLVAGLPASVAAADDGRWRVVRGEGQGEAIVVELMGEDVALTFAGWRERIGGASEEAEEVVALALDFVAAALFGELRVVEERVGETVLRRALEVEVGGAWRLHARRGGLGLRGLAARLRGDLTRSVRGDEGRLARAGRLRDARPSGLASAPWSGAAGDAAGEAASLAIDGELDLHNFSPKEVGRLVREYIEVCRGRGILELRIVHGKGKGVLRRTVHSLLERHPAVASFRLGGHGEGSWGATMVTLRPRAADGGGDGG
ncbi:MAG: Smr/MutS family protein [Nannocystaceae bacterium]